jgi:Rps23 Pro-64 3,4-dihydroxylase Tpa1-like proline 4-hydroxylase
MEDGSIQTCSRDIAVIYYLTRGWREEEGGHLVDLEAPAGGAAYSTAAVVWEILQQPEVLAAGGMHSAGQVADGRVSV